MKIYDGKNWISVAGDAGFVNNILTVGGENDRQIVVKDGNGEVLGIMSKDGIELNNAIFNNLQSESIVPIQKAITYYVNANTGDDTYNGLSSSKPFKTIRFAVEKLKNRKLIENCVIEIAGGTYNENIIIEGISGSGLLTMNFASGTIINGLVNVIGCSNMIYFACNQTILNQNETTLNYAFSSNYSSYVLVSNMIINGQKNTQHGVLAYRGSKVLLRNCSINNITNTNSATISAYENSIIYVENCTGTNNYRPLWSSAGSIITATTKIPKGTVANVATSGQIIGNAIQTASDVSVPSSPTKVIKTISFEGNSFNFYRSTLAKWQTGLYIGDFAKSTGGSGIGGNNLSVIGIDMASIRSQLTGKNITGVTVTLQRKTAGGYDTITNPTLAITTSTGTGSTPPVSKIIADLGGFTKGQTRTVSIPTTVINEIITKSTVKSFLLYRPDQTQYSIFENKFTLTVTYEEDITSIAETPILYDELAL